MPACNSEVAPFERLGGVGVGVLVAGGGGGWVALSGQMRGGLWGQNVWTVAARQ